LQPPRLSPACAVLTMDGTPAGSSSGTPADPEALLKPPGSPAPPDQWDEAQCASVQAHRAADGGGGLDVPSKGDTCQNGPTPPFPDPSSPLGSPTSPGGPDVSPGVAGFPDNLRKSQGTSAEGSVRKEALQSLRLSLPMQETQLCKHLFPLGSSPLSPNPLLHPLVLTTLQRHVP